MYLVSIYFDEKTNKILQNYIEQTAMKTGNKFMVEGKVPPHITVSAFETKRETDVLEKLDQAVQSMVQGEIQWVSVGVFLPYVLYIAPVLNEYLHEICSSVYESVKIVEETKISPYYRPFQWFPHTTIGKKMSKEELQIGFELLQKNFGVILGKVLKIGLAKTNPYQEIKCWTLIDLQKK